MPIRVSALYHTMTVQPLMNELGSVAGAMRRNPAFLMDNVPDYVPKWEQILAVREKLGAAFEAALTHDSNKIAERNAVQAEAVGLLDAVAKYYELMAVNNPSVLNDTGFSPRPPTKRDLLLGPLPGFNVYQGPQPESAVASAIQMSTAHTMEVHATQGDPSIEQNWRIAGASIDFESMVMYGFKPGQYFLRGRGLNRAGAGAWSEVITLVIK